MSRSAESLQDNSAKAGNETAVSQGLVSRYAGAVKLILWGWAFAIGIAAAQGIYREAGKPDPSEAMYRELVVQMIENGRWEDVETWVVWAIKYLADQKDKEESKQKTYEALLFENYILKYHNIALNGKQDVDFPIYYELSSAKVAAFPDLYENVIGLFFLRNSQEKHESLETWAQEWKSIRITFSPDMRKGRYVIRHIDLVDTQRTKAR